MEFLGKPETQLASDSGKVNKEGGSEGVRERGRGNLMGFFDRRK